MDSGMLSLNSCTEVQCCRHLAPGPLWCSWCPSPIVEDPRWARDWQGSAFKNFIAQAREAYSEARFSSTWKTTHFAFLLSTDWIKGFLLDCNTFQSKPLLRNIGRGIGWRRQRRADRFTGVCRREDQNRVCFCILWQESEGSSIAFKNIWLFGLWDGKTRSSHGSCPKWCPLHGVLVGSKFIWWIVVLRTPLSTLNLFFFSFVRKLMIASDGFLVLLHPC